MRFMRFHQLFKVYVPINLFGILYLGFVLIIVEQLGFILIIGGHVMDIQQLGELDNGGGEAFVHLGQFAICTCTSKPV